MTADCGIGWHRHPAGWWVWGIAAGEGCALCDEADAWALEQARVAPAVERASAPALEPAQTFAGALAARRTRRAAEQGDLF